MTEYVSQVAAHIRGETQNHLRPGRGHRPNLDLPLRRRARAPRGRARNRENSDGQNHRADHRRRFQPHSIHARPDALDITGTNVFNVTTSQLLLRHGPVFTDVLLADEINRTPPKTQAALLEAMEERQVTIDGESHSLSPMFLVLATENPIEYEGTYPLPEAQLDLPLRFWSRIRVSTTSCRSSAIGRRASTRASWKPNFNAIDDPAVIPQPRAGPRHESRTRRAGVPVESGAAHPRTPQPALGREPARGGVHAAGEQGPGRDARRDFVTPDDARDIIHPALRHRVLLRSEAEIEGVTPDSVLDEIVASVEVPR